MRESDKWSGINLARKLHVLFVNKKFVCLSRVPDLSLRSSMVKCAKCLRIILILGVKFQLPLLYVITWNRLQHWTTKTQKGETHEIWEAWRGEAALWGLFLTLFGFIRQGEDVCATTELNPFSHLKKLVYKIYLTELFLKLLTKIFKTFSFTIFWNPRTFLLDVYLKKIICRTAIRKPTAIF